jgi:hypothetical protein
MVNKSFTLVNARFQTGNKSQAQRATGALAQTRYLVTKSATTDERRGDAE